jgi:hypothetical protein
MHLIKSQCSEIPKKLNRELSYCSKVGVARNHQVPLHHRDERTYVAVAKTLERAEIEEARTTVYEIKEEDVEWLKQSLVGVFLLIWIMLPLNQCYCEVEWN